MLQITLNYTILLLKRVPRLRTARDASKHENHIISILKDARILMLIPHYVYFTRYSQ